MHFFDAFTVADSVNNAQTVWLIVLVMWIISIIAYVFIFRLAQKMSKF